MASQFKTFTAGSVLTASEVNSYLMKQAVIVCDATADYPASPVEGMTVYDKGADALKTYSTATTGWNPPWNMPWGTVAKVQVSTGVSALTSSSLTDIAGLSVTFTPVANRIYKLTAFCKFYGNAAANVDVAIDVSGTARAYDTLVIPSASLNFVTALAQTYITGLTATSTTIKGRWSTTAGTLTAQLDANFPWFLLVEDIGPSGAPA